MNQLSLRNRCLTIELTWSETEYTNFEFNGQREKKIAARALTPNDLLAIAIHFKNLFRLMEIVSI